MNRDEMKAAYHAYRETAKALIGNAAPLRISVPEHAPVQMAEDGAFVECVLWIPAACITKETQA